MADDLKQSVKGTTSAAKETVDTAAGSLQNAAGQLQDAADQISKVGGNMQRALDKSLAEQPYATLLVALGMGFVLGSLWKS